MDPHDTQPWQKKISEAHTTLQCLYTAGTLTLLTNLQHVWLRHVFASRDNDLCTPVPAGFWRVSRLHRSWEMGTRKCYCFLQWSAEGSWLGKLLRGRELKKTLFEMNFARILRYKTRVGLRASWESGPGSDNLSKGTDFFHMLSGESHGPGFRPWGLCLYAFDLSHATVEAHPPLYQHHMGDRDSNSSRLDPFTSNFQR